MKELSIDKADVMKTHKRSSLSDITPIIKENGVDTEDTSQHHVEESDTLEEDFLLKAISAVQENSSDEDGIDDIDIDFDEGDSNALIHQKGDGSLAEQKLEELNFQNKHAEINAALITIPIENEITKDTVTNMKGITVEIFNPTTATAEKKKNGSNHTIHYKPVLNNATSMKPKETLSELRARHDFMCKCDSCQVLSDTYKEFVNEKQRLRQSILGPPPSKIPRESEVTGLPHTCHTCNTVLSSYKEYRIHLQQMHPKHWNTIKEFEEKRKSVVRKNSLREIPLHGNFFKKELQRVTPTPPSLPAVNSTQTPSSPYFYPMMYPVYFVMDNNNQPVPVPVPGIGSPFTIPQMPRGAPAMSSPLSASPPVPASVISTPTNQHNKLSTRKSEPFVCGNCGLTFSFKDHLVLHMRIHNEKPFKCDSCGLSFINNVELKRHYRTHTFSKKCFECNEHFVSQGHLTEHINSVHNFVSKNDRSCLVCDLGFSSHKSWARHMELHSHSGNAYLCNQCGQSYVDSKALQHHLQTHPKSPSDANIVNNAEMANRISDEIKFKCGICTFECDSSSRLHTHKEEHMNYKTYKCEECGAQFKTKSQRKAHILTHTGERPFKCHLCKATFIQQGNLKRHIWTHTGEKPHICEVCNAGFLSTSDLKRHLRIHTGEKPYKCHMCSFSFTTSGNLKSHLKSHLKLFPEYIAAALANDELDSSNDTHNDSGNNVSIKEEPLDCDDMNSTSREKCYECSKSFVSHESLTEHINSVHKHLSLDRRCIVCDLGFNSNQSWERHMALHSHTGDTFLCFQCGLSFVDKKTLHQHCTKTHPKSPSDELEFRCGICDFECDNEDDFNTHKTKQHATEKGYGCEECGALFKTKSQRKAHILTHTGERSFKCHLCPGTFLKQGHLKRHIRTHTGENPHDCEICKVSFISIPDLTSHMESHKEKSFKCHLCLTVFTTSAYLETHLKSHLKHKSVSSTTGNLDSLNDIPNGNCEVNIKEEPVDIDEENSTPLKECHECCKNFVSHEQLTKHINLVHKHLSLGRRCIVCDLGFNSNQVCDKHMELVHSGQALPCFQCGLSFDNKKTLHQHFIQKHTNTKSISDIFEKEATIYNKTSYSEPKSLSPDTRATDDIQNGSNVFIKEEPLDNDVTNGGLVSMDGVEDTL